MTTNDVDDALETDGRVQEKPKPRSWSVTTPTYPRATLRLCAYALSSMRDADLLKCVLQVVEKGYPLAEYPIAVEWRTESALQDWIAQSKADGWTFTLDPSPDNGRARDNKQAADKVRRARKTGKCPKCKGEMGEDHGPWYCRACMDKANRMRRERREKLRFHSTL